MEYGCGVWCLREWNKGLRLPSRRWLGYRLSMAIGIEVVIGYVGLDGLRGTMVYGEGWEDMMVCVGWSANNRSSRKCVVMGTGHD